MLLNKSELLSMMFTAVLRNLCQYPAHWSKKHKLTWLQYRLPAETHTESWNIGHDAWQKKQQIDGRSKG